MGSGKKSAPAPAPVAAAPQITETPVTKELGTDKAISRVSSVDQNRTDGNTTPSLLDDEKAKAAAAASGNLLA